MPHVGGSVRKTTCLYLLVFVTIAWYIGGYGCLNNIINNVSPQSVLWTQCFIHFQFSVDSFAISKVTVEKPTQSFQMFQQVVAFLEKMNIPDVCGCTFLFSSHICISLQISGHGDSKTVN